MGISDVTRQLADVDEQLRALPDDAFAEAVEVDPEPLAWSRLGFRGWGNVDGLGDLLFGILIAFRCLTFVVEGIFAHRVLGFQFPAIPAAADGLPETQVDVEDSHFIVEPAAGEGDAAAVGRPARRAFEVGVFRHVEGLEGTIDGNDVDVPVEVLVLGGEDDPLTIR